MVVESSSISLEGSAELRKMLSAEGIEYRGAGERHAKVIKAAS